MKIELTTNSPRSCYGVPISRIDGVDYGPADRVSGAGISAAAIVADWAAQEGRTTEDRMEAHRFCRQWHEGPQVKNPAAQALGRIVTPARLAAAKKASKTAGRPKKKR